MEKSSVDETRREFFLGCAALAVTPFIGCASLESRHSEHVERREFIESAMLSLQKEALEESLTQQSRGAAAAMSLAMLVPFRDWDFYYVKGGAIIWRPNQGQTFQSVIVQEGFVTDLASIPRFFWQILRPEGRHAYAAVVHDYLYWTQDRPREEADLILEFALEDSNVSDAERWAFFQAVDKLGGRAWRNNKNLKENGERRILKKLPNDLSISWSDWKQIPGNLK